MVSITFLILWKQNLFPNIAHFLASILRSKHPWSTPTDLSREFIFIVQCLSVHFSLALRKFKVNKALCNLSLGVLAAPVAMGLEEDATAVSLGLFMENTSHWTLNVGRVRESTKPKWKNIKYLFREHSQYNGREQLWLLWWRHEMRELVSSTHVAPKTSSRKDQWLKHYCWMSSYNTHALISCRKKFLCMSGAKCLHFRRLRHDDGDFEDNPGSWWNLFQYKTQTKCFGYNRSQVSPQVLFLGFLWYILWHFLLSFCYKCSHLLLQP